MPNRDKQAKANAPTQRASFLKKILAGQILFLLVLAIFANSALQIIPKEELGRAQSFMHKMEHALASLRANHSELKETLHTTQSDIDLISEVIGEIEEKNGITIAPPNNLKPAVQRTMLERLSVISDYFASKTQSYGELDVRMNAIESRIGIDESDAHTEAAPIEARIELASLSSRQQELLFKTIPNGYPLRDTKITSLFGKRTHPTTKQASFHRGVDLNAPLNTKISVTADGVITKSSYNKLSGNFIVVTHNYGFETHYAHLNEIKVKIGDFVQKGDFIGVSGNTGRSSGPHLHYEVRYIGKALNPVNFITWDYGDQDLFTKERGIKWQSLISLINNQQLANPILQLSQVTPKSKAL